MKLRILEARLVHDEDSGWTEVTSATDEELALNVGKRTREAFWKTKVQLSVDAIEMRIAEEKADA